MKTVPRNFLITLLLAFDPLGGSPQQVAEYVKAEIVKWGKVVRDTGAKPD